MKFFLPDFCEVRSSPNLLILIKSDQKKRSLCTSRIGCFATDGYHLLQTKTPMAKLFLRSYTNFNTYLLFGKDQYRF